MRRAKDQVFHRIVGERVRIARRMADLKQKEVSERLGFKDRQILSNIEAGKRKVSADELMALMGILGQDIEFFTDPYLITEERVFSWRAEQDSDLVRDFDSKARIIISAYRRFSDLLGKGFNPLSHRLAITKLSSFEEAAATGERVAEILSLGQIPSQNLSRMIADKLNIPVLFVNAPPGISGAACRVQEFNFILINMKEPVWRRNFDLAHELFHVLTWDTMPPEPIDPWGELENGGARREKLANNFAAGILMPSSSLRPKWESRGNSDIDRHVLNLSQEFGVSGTAMYYRLNNLGWLSEKDQATVDKRQLRRSLSNGTRGSRPKLYSREFAERVHDVLEKALVSRRKVAELLYCTIEDIADLLSDYDMEMPY